MEGVPLPGGRHGRGGAAPEGPPVSACGAGATTTGEARGLHAGLAQAMCAANESLRLFTSSYRVLLEGSSQDVEAHERGLGVWCPPDPTPGGGGRGVGRATDSGVTLPSLSVSVTRSAFKADVFAARRLPETTSPSSCRDRFPVMTCDRGRLLPRSIAESLTEAAAAARGASGLNA